MNNWVQCPRCERFSFNPAGTCICKRYELVIPWMGKVDGDFWTELWARDTEEAVERFCEQDDAEGDYIIIRNSGTPEVWCRDDAGVVTRWSVTAEAVPTYTAHELKQEAAK